ncbi:MAG TPA: DUF983 domain-containing protein [Acidimicrobiales bacterium]|nr:DUF983 domain-containing protein [Acidimicrobiales bacterium]
MFVRWLKLRDRCPRCGLHFEREEGFFTGVYLVNYSFVAVAIVIELFVFLIYVNANENATLLPAMAVGAATALLLPLLTYPYAKTIWIAIDLATRPLDPVEEADAALHASENEPPVS